MRRVPAIRIRSLNEAPVRPRGAFVLYWMVAARRTRWSFGLQRAVEHARALGRPLLVLEALRCDHRWASDRIHRFVIEGMADNQRRLEGHGVLYHPYVEPAPGAGRGLIRALGARAAAIVTDDFPAFGLQAMTAAAASRVDVRMEAVDGNGLLPLAATGRSFPSAYTFRRFLQAHLPAHLGDLPAPDPLARLAPGRRAALPREVARRWPRATPALLAASPEALAALPIDHTVGPGAARGGETAGRAALRGFVARLARYERDRNQPGLEATSGLSPYLHFGHVAAAEVWKAVARDQGWSAGALGRHARGRRAGWWGMSAPAEGFLDQLVTWRELGFNFCARRADHDRYAAVPGWARDTLARHAADPRPTRYGRAALERARTHDPLWNAAQLQLVREGRMHNYLRMLWGKKILEWSASPEQALATMIELNNTYALDGRDPNSYASILWILGLFDRPWGPERPIFGTVRYMSSASTARKLRVGEYVARYAP